MQKDRHGGRSFLRSLAAILVKGGVAGVEVLAVEAVLGRVEGLGKALVVDDLALAEEFEGNGIFF